MFHRYPQLDESEQLMYSFHLNKLRTCMEKDFVTDRLLRLYLMITVMEQMPCVTKASRDAEEAEDSANSSEKRRSDEVQPNTQRSSSSEPNR